MRPAVPAPLHALVVVVRQRVGQSRLLWWGIVAALAGLAAAVVHHTAEDADRRRAAWGESTPVVVARRDLGPGELLDAEAVALEERPLAVVPSGALTELPLPGTVAVTAIVAGEVVPRARAGPWPGGSADGLPAGTLGVAVPLDPASAAALSLRPGTPVDVVVTNPLTGAPALATTGGAVVVAVGEAVVVVAVPEAAAPTVASAASAGAAAVVIRPLP